MNEAITFLAVGPLCWGRGLTIREATDEARKHWPSGDYAPRNPKTKKRIERHRAQVEHFTIYTSSDPKVYVNEAGSICRQQGTTLGQMQESSLTVGN